MTLSQRQKEIVKELNAMAKYDFGANFMRRPPYVLEALAAWRREVLNCANYLHAENTAGASAALCRARDIERSGGDYPMTRKALALACEFVGIGVADR